MITGGDTWLVALTASVPTDRRRPRSAAGHRLRAGRVRAVGCGPLFWPLVKRAGALELLAHRVIWSLVVCVILLLTVVPRGWWAEDRDPRGI